MKQELIKIDGTWYRTFRDSSLRGDWKTAEREAGFFLADSPESGDRSMNSHYRGFIVEDGGSAYYGAARWYIPVSLKRLQGKLRDEINRSRDPQELFEVAQLLGVDREL